MNHDEIIRIAKEAGYVELANDSAMYPPDFFERFAALIEQHLYYDGIHTCHVECQRPACVAVRDAVKAEREACAQLCESRFMGDLNREDMEARRCAEAIRARGEA